MFRLGVGTWAILLCLFFSSPSSFAGEIYRWTDEKGGVHFTDDPSQVPAQYQNQLDKREMNEESSETAKEQTVPGHRQGAPTEASKPSMKQQGKPDRAKEHVEAVDRKIEAKKAIEKKILELEKELKAKEERIRFIKEDESYRRPADEYRYNDRLKKYVPVPGKPKELERLELRITKIKKEIASLEEQLSKINRGL
jgi:hypothetical protein